MPECVVCGAADARYALDLEYPVDHNETSERVTGALCAGDADWLGLEILVEQTYTGGGNG